ncbi:alpha-2-macroglobulin family protein [Fulvivirga lutea]|uniref:Alpha-2-macroglobulin n=1 Tax=Fulvivirga lutea TaxID=2810512 RepID=A0A974WFY6_9BACT|nr:MG2 domain-containing protein [Fulvivirga lutea]QSE97084.1 hypothetical protein JR347_16040 [Fulvivirga lutea]
MRYYLLLPILLFLASCGKDSPTEGVQIDPAFTGYISAFTSGTVSNQSTIQIRFRENVSAAIVGEEVDSDLFEIVPEIKGKAHWVSENTIEFTPEKTLPSNKLFEVRFELGDVIEVPEKLKVLVFQFQTIEQRISINFEGLEAYNKKDLSWQRLNGNLITSDFALEEQVEQSLSATQAGKKVKLKWDHSVDGRTHNFRIDSVSRGKTVNQVVLVWDGKPMDSDSKGERVVEVPPLGDFSVMEMRLTQQPDQFITLYFSDPLDSKQELNGLIYLKSGDKVRFSVDNNTVKVYPVNRLTAETDIIVNRGVKNSMGYQLKAEFTKKVKFSNIKPDVKLLGDGIILPSTDGLVLPFKAVNLSGLNVKIIKIFEDNITQFFQVNQFDGTRELKRVGRLVYKESVDLQSLGSVDFGTWNTFGLDLSKIINVEPGAIYRVSLSFDINQSLYPCAGNSVEEGEVDFLLDDPEMDAYDQVDGYYYYDDYYYDDYYYYNDGYDYNERDNPCHPSYYMRNQHVVTRNVFASDLGIIAKKGEGSQVVVAVSDIRTALTMEGVSVELLNLQGQIIGSGTTDANGLAKINAEGKPFMLAARKGLQVGYLKMDDGSALSQSMFDVSGSEVRKGLKGFIYGDRGVWRPGDSLYVAFMLEDALNVIPNGHPIVMELYTPENQLYKRKVKTKAVKGIYDFRTVTEQDAPTGNWLAKVKVGGASFTKTLRIETVKPNRLKINLKYEDEILRNKKSTSGNLELKWLHGAIAKNLKADIEVTLDKGQHPFKKFNNYVFHDPSKDFDAETQFIFDGKVNEQGVASVPTNINVNSNTPGILQANFKIRAYEQGGDFSVDRFSMPFSPYTSYVGVKVPEGQGWRSALYSNEANLIPIVTLDETGNPVSRSGLKVEVYEIGWRWWWQRNESEDLASYIRSNSRNRLISDEISTGADGKAMYELNFKNNTWGRKLIKVTDPVSGHSTGQIFYTSYRGYWSAGSAGPGGAEMLTFRTNKETYNVGEQVEITLPAGEQGRALISLETGSEVVDAFWVESTGKESKYTFEVTDKMAPNVFVHVSYVQPHNLKSNDRPIRLYGIQSIGVEDPATHLMPVINMPDVLEPESKYTIEVSEKEGKEMAYTIAVVDDGLLDLTRFKTPNPWDHFYSKEALGIKTWDMYKYVMGAYAGELAGLLAIGGDEELNAGGDGKKANRFKPVVSYLGPFYLKSGQKKKHTLEMPNYIGSVRAMVVAGSEFAYGNAQKTIPVKKPLMVLSTLPRVVGPNETIDVPVTIFAMDKKIKNVRAEIQANELFEIVGSDKQTTRFSEEGEQTVYFKLKAKEAIGIGKVEVVVSSSGERASHETELDVRIANPPVTVVQDAALEPGKSWSTTYEALGVLGTNEATLEFSKIPSINLGERIEYLIRYPHGCIEQTTSSVFPQLHLAKLMDLTEKQKQETEDNIRAGINRLKNFQLSDGSFAYWPGNLDYSEWGTSYAGHFLLEAEAAGYSLPYNFKKSWIKFQTGLANNWMRTQSQYSYLMQAYRLYTLALAGSPALGAMNRMKEVPNLSTAAKWRLAAAYVLAGKERVAKEIVSNTSTYVEKYNELGYTYGSSLRDQAMILETLVLLKDFTNAKSVLDEIVDQFGKRQWYSTQTVSYTLIAISKLLGTDADNKEMNFSYTINGGGKQTEKTSNAISSKELEFSNNKVSVTNNGNGMLFVRLSNSGTPLESDLIDQENNLNMTVKYTNMNGAPIDVTRLEQGTDFIAEVTVSHPGLRARYDEMALTQIFPSGWEIRNLRMDLNTAINTGDVPEYQDIRDDRVMTYFDIVKGDSKTFRIILNAAYTGSYYLAATHCGAMYDDNISAYKAGKWVEVVKAE